MASIITATTTSGLTQSADNSGVLQLASGTGNLVTIPSVTGTAMVSGNMPTFFVFNSSSQSLGASAFTVLQCQTKVFDTAGAYNNSGSTATLNGISVPAWCFAPPVAGYYLIQGGVAVGGGMTAQFCVSLYKNGGSEYTRGTDLNTTTSTGLSVSTIMQFNGTSDYVDIRPFVNSSSKSTTTGQALSYFQGILIRGA
jgi:hypothetical protein